MVHNDHLHGATGFTRERCWLRPGSHSPRCVEQARGRKLTFPESAGGGVVSITANAEHVKASLRTKDTRTAKERHAAALSYLSRYWQALREGPRRLTQKQVVGLAGIVYRALAFGGEDDPGPASLWERVIRLSRELQEGKHDLADLMIEPTPEAVRDAALRFHYGPIADALLSSEGLVVDDDSRWRLIVELPRAMTKAASKLHRNAKGDYRPDPTAARFPTWQRESDHASGTTISQLVSGWEVERVRPVDSLSERIGSRSRRGCLSA